MHKYKYSCTVRDITCSSMGLTHVLTCLTCLYFSDTFGIQSVVITNTTGGRLCLECSFSSFGTGTGCTVELVSSGSEKYTYRDTFIKRGNTAKGCVSGVTAGEYVIKVFDQSSSELVHRIDNVTVSMLQLPLTTTTIMVFSSVSLVIVQIKILTFNEDDEETFTLVSYDVFIINESCYELNVFHLLLSSRNT